MEKASVDWPSLWEREPGLRPEGLRPDDEYPSQTWAQWIETFPDQVSRGYMLKQFAALCRDAAVRWLANTCGGCEVRYECVVGDERTAAVILRDEEIEPYGAGVDTDEDFFEGPTTDAALFAACVSVLDARDAAHK